MIEADSDSTSEAAVEAEVEAEAAGLSAAEVDSSAAGKVDRRRRWRHHHHGGGGGKGMKWVPGAWQCLQWGGSSGGGGGHAHKVRARRKSRRKRGSPLKCATQTWCQRNCFWKNQSKAHQIYYAWKCGTSTPSSQFGDVPSDEHKRADWCLKAEKAKKSRKYVKWYHKQCGGSPKKPATFKGRPLSPPPPKKRRAEWCTKHEFLRWSNSGYFCSKCCCGCGNPQPEVPEGIAAAPTKGPARQNWCQSHKYMRYSGDSDYYYSKCGGRPPTHRPKQPDHIDPPPKKAALRKNWCEDNNYMRYSKKWSAYFYAKCNGIVPATPRPQPPKPTAVKAAPAVTSPKHDHWCHDHQWMRQSTKENKDYYCSKCSCPVSPPPPMKPAQVHAPPARKADRKPWCQQYAYLRYQPTTEAYFCGQCGCKKPRAPVVAPKLPADVKPPPKKEPLKHQWCEENGWMRFEKKYQVWFYRKCGGAPRPKPDVPTTVPPAPKSRGPARKTWCEENKKVQNSDYKDYYCSKCRCSLPPPPPAYTPKLRGNWCQDNKYMIDTNKKAFYYSKCGGEPAKEPVHVEPEVKKPSKTVVEAPPPGTKQVHVHVNVAAPKVTKSNSALNAMVARIDRKNSRAAEKMEAILKKLRKQDCRGGKCLPHIKDMEKWKADWILETEETGGIVP
jgi:hypothetical protein